MDIQGSFNTQLSKKTGADNSVFDVDEKLRLAHSDFPYSRKKNTVFDIGQYLPFDWFPVHPGEKVRIKNRYMLETLPLANPPLTNYLFRIRWYYIKNSSCWKGWNSFVSQGRKGQVSAKKIPSLTKEDLKGYLLPSSLAVALDLPVCEFVQNTKFPQFATSKKQADELVPDNDFSVVDLPHRNIPVGGVSVLPFMAYQKIWRYDTLPQNLLQDNEEWLPEDLSEEWRIDYLASNFKKGFFRPQHSISDEDVADFVTHNVPSVNDTAINLLEMRYAVYERDYFTSAKPFLVRGDEASAVGLSVDGKVDFDELIDSLVVFPSGNDQYGYYISASGETSGQGFALGFGRNSAGNTVGKITSSGDMDKVKASLKLLYSKVKLSQGSAALTANKLREMLAFSVWQERNALTNGSYNEFVKAHFNKNPSQPDYEPYYMGGSTQTISFAQILQTSSSVDGSPLGTQAGTGQCNGQTNSIDFVSPDYGMMMGICTVVPEVYYEQGVGHKFTDLLPEEQFMPEFARTGFEPILNQEIYAQNNAQDLELYGYQTRNAYLKARENVASGLMAVPYEFDRLFGSFVQSREFEGLPKLSLQFVSVSPENVRRDFMAYENYPAFKLQIATDMSIIRALPYQSTPETFGF